MMVVVEGRLRWWWCFWEERVERGRVLEGWEVIRVLRMSKGLRFFWVWMKVSRYGSWTHLTLALMKVR